MPKMSAGILLFRFKNMYPEILLFHPGGNEKGTNKWQIQFKYKMCY